jgi:hypothetical protein
MFRAVFCVLFALGLAAPAETPVVCPPALEAALERISPDSLRGNLSFLASDLLEGRGTPSRGLDIAAEYIAAQFRRVGLETAGDDGYFQTAHFLLSRPKPETFELKLETRGATVIVHDNVSVGIGAGLAIDSAAAVKVGDALPKPEEVAGKVVFLEHSALPGRRPDLLAMHPLLVVLLGPFPSASRPGVVDPDDRAALPPVIRVSDDALAKAVAGNLADAKVWVHVDAPEDTPVKLRNVIGVLRGSDAALKDSYVLVTAHYDHLGAAPDCNGDCIFNGANDDASGTVSVIELANALAGLHPRPRRSIVFMTLFGEEKGSLGAHYYTRHPVFPLVQTVADVNLEQLGRTDATEGPQVGTATFTGFGFSDLPKVFQLAGQCTGVKVHSSAASNDYFSRSDNRTFAAAGIPAHTLAVAYEYPDYHGVGDSWQKIDYANMAKVDRMAVLGLYMLADNAKAPRWSENDPKAAPYLKAWREMHAPPSAN